MRKVKRLSAVFVLTGLLAGCAAPSYDVEVYLSPKFKEQLNVYPSLEVDIAGVNANEGERFASCLVDEYFQIGNALRSSTEHFTLYFSEDSIVPKRLDSGNPVWRKFGRKDAEQLYLLVNIPQESGKSTGPKDARKIMIPLERTGLFGSNRRCFEISPAGIISLKERPEGYPKPESAENRKETEQ